MSNQVKYEKISTQGKLPIKVVSIKLDGSQSEKRVSKHWHRSLEFIIPMQNASEVWMEGEIYHICPGATLLVNSRAIHECGSVNPSLMYEGYAIQLRYDFIKEILPEIDNYHFDIFYDEESHPYMFHLLKKIIKMNESDSLYKEIRIRGLAYELLYELVSHYCLQIEENKIHQDSKNKGRMVDILSYLDEHVSEPFDAKVVADQFHISYGHLAKMFKNELGMTMKEYVNSVRVRNASFDLLTSNQSVLEIALHHGFVSSKAFYKEFEKVYHMTPKQYRKQQKHA